MSDEVVGASSSQEGHLYILTIYYCICVLRLDQHHFRPMVPPCLQSMKLVAPIQLAL